MASYEYACDTYTLNLCQLHLGWHCLHHHSIHVKYSHGGLFTTQITQKDRQMDTSISLVFLGISEWFKAFLCTVVW